jgi:hypothetical protein
MRQLFATIVLISSLLAQAQHEFAPIGAEWYYEKMLSYNPPEAGYIKITSIKDSVIENKDVRVLEVIFAPDDTTQILEGYEYIHQSGDTIWYYKNKQFHMLYNFAMQKGDSILLYSEMENNCGDNPYGWNKVDSTFTRAINDIGLKAYYLKPFNNSHWEFSNYVFEIFGSMDYFFPENSFCGIYDIITNGPIRCYSDPVHGTLITSLPQMRCDTTYTYSGPINVKDVSTGARLFSVYPNPVAEVLSITGFGYNTLQGNYKISIINTKGQVIESHGSALKNINVSHLAKGTYFLGISINDKIIDYEKFIKL